MASFKVTLDATLLAVMTTYTEQVLDDAIRRLADKYGFDTEDAKQFLQSGGIVVKYPPLEREKLPWTGDVRTECCKAIKKNGGLFTQCTGSIHSDDWCKPCSKEVAKKGKPTCGTVADRAAVGVLEYQVGPVRVKPYVEYMKKHGIAREQVDKACDDYGITIDPTQFELKKRARKSREMAAAIDAEAPSLEEEEDAMTAATGADPEEQLESDDEDDYEPPATPTPTAPTAPTAPTPPTPTAPTAPTPPTPTAPTAPAAPTPEPAAELAEEPMKITVNNGPPVAPISAEQVSTMDKKNVQAHCKARGIDTDSKGLVQLKRELTASIKNA
jgi:hypothetical protein